MKAIQKNSGESTLGSWGRDWRVGVRLWVERAGHAILGPGRAELLESIDQLHSISAAARRLGMSYRRAWLLVQSVNEAAGEPFVTALSGGSGGGGAVLTPRGQKAVATFRKLCRETEQHAAGFLMRHVASPSQPVLHVAAAVSLENVLSRLLTDYALRCPTIRIRAIYGASDELLDHILSGARTDVYLSADPTLLPRITAAGLSVNGPLQTLVTNDLVAIGPASDATPSVRRLSDLAKVFPLRVALADPTCPLGRYTRRCLAQALPKLDFSAGTGHLENSRAVVAAVQAGQADVGFVYGSDATAAFGCRTLFAVPSGDVDIRYTGCVLANGAAGDDARSLLEYFASAAAAPRFRECGFQVAKGTAKRKKR